MSTDDEVLEAEKITEDLRSGVIGIGDALSRLRKLSLSHPDNAYIARLRAKVLVSALIKLASEEKLKEAEGVFEELLEVTSPFSNVGVILERLDGVVAALALLARGEKTIDIPRYLGILRDAYRSMTSMFNFAFSLGAGLSNAIYQYAEVGNWQEVKALAAELLELGREWEATRVQLTVSQGLFNAIVAANSAGRLDVSEPLLSALIEQASCYLNARETQLMLAKALADSIYNFGVRGKTGEVSMFLEILRSIKVWGNDPEFQVVMSTAFKYTLLVYHKFKMLDEFKAIMEEFEAFAERTGNQKIKEDLASIKRLLNV
ncbi:MAG: hypothetical protein QXI20_09695 [Candidatus Jordarchaeales archaeon]